MADFLQLLISGLATGAIYALAAIGFTLLWQTSQTINFAQGEFVMLPAFFALVAMTWLGLPFAVAVVIAIVCSMLVLGLMFKVVVVQPLIKQGVLPLVISTIALSVLLKEGVKDVYSAEAQPFPTLFPDVTLSVAGVAVSLAQVGVLVVAFGTIVALQWFLGATRIGRQMQATAQNPTVARILGVPVERMILYTFLINAVLAAMASILISPIYLAKFSNGESLGLAAFVAAIVGGFNQVRGAIVGGLLIGVVDNLAAAYVSTSYRQAVPLILLVAIILFRPQGLLGRREERAV
ncbi:branched-chain amino acid ABC transporter permease [Vineibacter terrae]|uniref:Branched-chain amino acid ABC transporter permease n=1 Tax=Vineibacter terrae TaxID=2586908 RepID=A0A5C8PA81_9HYPH|nr:branched-chain amino acid ABC transporter permease [Vineibacter terrae]TXL70699.1 branched-chain amino acid ABC transporter permease [Vineibacter terrae]